MIVIDASAIIPTDLEKLTGPFLSSIHRVYRFSGRNTVDFSGDKESRKIQRFEFRPVLRIFLQRREIIPKISISEKSRRIVLVVRNESRAERVFVFAGIRQIRSESFFFLHIFQEAIVEFVIHSCS